MTEEQDPFILRMNIAHYETMLNLKLNDLTRQTLLRLIAKSRRNLGRASAQCTGAETKALWQIKPLHR
jgi:hypothetical protein